MDENTQTIAERIATRYTAYQDVNSGETIVDGREVEWIKQQIKPLLSSLESEVRAEERLRLASMYGIPVFSPQKDSETPQHRAYRKDEEDFEDMKKAGRI